MSKQVYFFLLFLSTFVTAKSQDNAEFVAYGSFMPWFSYEEGKKVTARTIVTDANVRDKPSTTANVVAKLPIATTIQVESVTSDTTKLNGYSAPWCKVSYSLNGKTQSGYLWGGILAGAAYEVNADYDESRHGLVYMAGVSSVNEKDNKWTMQVRVAKNGVELAKTEYAVNADVGYSIQLTNLGSLGFKNVVDAIACNVHFPACGYGSYDNLLFFTGKKISSVLSTSSMADGGAFYDDEDYILPADKGGIQDHILVVRSMAEMEDKEIKPGVYETLMIKQEYSIKLYKWQGDKLVKVKELK
jgi:hypothetical protein